MSATANPVSVIDAPVPPSNESKMNGRTEANGTLPQFIIYPPIRTPYLRSPPLINLPPINEPSGSPPPPTSLYVEMTIHQLSEPPNVAAALYAPVEETILSAALCRPAEFSANNTKEFIQVGDIDNALADNPPINNSSAAVVVAVAPLSAFTPVPVALADLSKAAPPVKPEYSIAVMPILLAAAVVVNVTVHEPPLVIFFSLPIVTLLSASIMLLTSTT